MPDAKSLFHICDCSSATSVSLVSIQSSYLRQKSEQYSGFSLKSTIETLGTVLPPPYSTSIATMFSVLSNNEKEGNALLEVFLVLDDCSHNLVLQVCLLYGVEAYLPIEHSKVRPITLGKGVVPIFEPFTCSARAIVSRIASFLLGEGVVELIFGSESSIELIFEIIHKLPVSSTLVVVIPQPIVVNITLCSVMTISTIKASSSIEMTSIRSLTR